jgi:uncharacterized protein (TIGR03083 family)
MAPFPPVDVVDLFAGERAALLDLLAGLAADDWWRPTVCGDWTVHDVALHLVAVDCQQLAGGRDGFAGPPAVRPATDLSQWANLVTYIDERNDLWVEATRRISPRLVRELLAFTGQRLAAYWPTIDLDALGPSVDWAGPGPAPYWLHVAREYTERWTHQQHIRDAVGKPGLTERRWFLPVLDTFVRALPYTLRDVDAPVGTHVQLVITGEAGGRWSAVCFGDGWRLEGDVGGTPDASATMDQDLAWRLFTKGVVPDDVKQAATLTGDRALAERALSMVSIIA